MRVCILSMQDVQNMGSLLQSYALKNILIKMGLEVSFLPIESREKDNLLLQNRVEDFGDEAEYIGRLSRLKKIDQYLLIRLKNSSLRKKQFGIYDEFRERYLTSPNLSKIQNYDYCIIGSDEVFNCCNKTRWGFTSQLFGNVDEADHVITYAASCGSTTVQKIPSEAAECIKNAMANLEAISVRDKNTKDFVRALTGADAFVHLDPVLVYNFKDEIERSVSVEGLPKSYCVIYSYDNRIHAKTEIESIKDFCKKYKMTPLCVGIPQFWIKDYIIADPFQCLKIFQKAKFVITDTFHGTIFSAKYSKRFATIVRGSNRNKLQDLIDRIGISNHQISQITSAELERTFVEVHDKKRFDSLIKEERVRSISYLTENIKEENSNRR